MISCKENLPGVARSLPPPPQQNMGCGVPPRSQPNHAIYPSTHLVVARADQRLGLVVGEAVLLQPEVAGSPHAGPVDLFHQVALPPAEERRRQQTDGPSSTSRRKKPASTEREPPKTKKGKEDVPT